MNLLRQNFSLIEGGVSNYGCVNEMDIAAINKMLKDYNLSKREESEDVPLGIFLEDENGNKQAGLTADTFGNWLA